VVPDKAKKEASYRPSAFYWRADIRAARSRAALTGFLRDLTEEIATHDTALAALGIVPDPIAAAPGAKAAVDALRSAALGLVSALEQRKADLRARGCIPPKSRLSPSEKKAKPHLLGG
jgi:hypothetical protein